MPVQNAAHRKSSLYASLVGPSSWLPWRLRIRLQRWIETRARARLPSLYQWAHFGRLHDPVRPVTSGPKHHFFGYYDKCPWNASGRLLLAHEVAFNDRPPSADDTVTLGVVRLDRGNVFEPLATSRAWNWQQGAMLQWHPVDPERLVLYNDRGNDQPVGVVRTSEGREVRRYDLPIYAVTPDGRQALSLNFARLHTHRPGYGYTGVVDRWSDALHPKEDGINLLDLESGASALIVSLDQLARSSPTDDMAGVHHWVNHIQISPDGRYFAFFHLWRKGEQSWRVRLFSARVDGSELTCLLDAPTISHYDWMNGEAILVWADLPQYGKRFVLCNRVTGSHTVVGDGVLTEDGHCSFSPDRRWLLNDTYPDSYQMRTLMLFRLHDARRHDIARLYSPKDRWWGEIRCDLHPRWNRDGTRVCIDSVHSGERQLYVIDVGDIVS